MRWTDYVKIQDGRDSGRDFHTEDTEMSIAGAGTSLVCSQEQAVQCSQRAQAKGRVKRAEIGEGIRARGSRRASWEMAGFEIYSQYDKLIGGV